MKKIIITSILCVLLVGCKSLKIAYYDAHTVVNTPSAPSQVIINYDVDEFTQQAWLTTEYHHSDFKDNNYSNGIVYKFRSLYKGGSPSFTQIYFSLKLPDWYFVDKAIGKGGHEFEFIRIDRETWSAGNVYETFAINLNESEMNFLKEADYDIKIIGKRGSEVITISSIVAKAFSQRQESFSQDN